MGEILISKYREQKEDYGDIKELKGT